MFLIKCLRNQSHHHVFLLLLSHSVHILTKFFKQSITDLCPDEQRKSLSLKRPRSPEIIACSSLNLEKSSVEIDSFSISFTIMHTHHESQSNQDRAIL